MKKGTDNSRNRNTFDVRKTVAPSKINLYLKVTGRRDDGYHNLCSLVVPLAHPSDQVTLLPSSVADVFSDNPDVPGGKENICCRALEEYAAAAGIPLCRKVIIEKHIPVAAGLGGGSSDAAAVLRLLNAEYGMLPASELNSVARRCGADVAFFLQAGAAVISGIGETVEPLACAVASLPLLLVNPGFPVSAAWAYRHLACEDIGEPDEKRLSRLRAALVDGDASAIGKLIHNDLAPALYRKFPLLRIIRSELLQAGASGVEISGSGPTLFALCRDNIQRAAIAAAMRESHPAAIIIETST